MNQWQGKKWYCYGTSMTDNRIREGKNGAAEAGMGYYRIAKDDTPVQDQIHLTEKGGELLARYYWGKLKNLYPYD